MKMILMPSLMGMLYRRKGDRGLASAIRSFKRRKTAKSGDCSFRLISQPKNIRHRRSSAVRPRTRAFSPGPKLRKLIDEENKRDSRCSIEIQTILSPSRFRARRPLAARQDAKHPVKIRKMPGRKAIQAWMNPSSLF